MKACTLSTNTKVNIYGTTEKYRVNIYEINNGLYIYIHDLKSFSEDYVNTDDMRMLDTFKKNYPTLFSRDRDYIAIKKDNFLSVNALKHLLMKSRCWENLDRDSVIKDISNPKILNAKAVNSNQTTKAFSINSENNKTFKISDDSIKEIKKFLKNEIKLFNDEQIDYILDNIISNITIIDSETSYYKDFYDRVKSMINE